MRRFFFKCRDCLSVGAADLASYPRGQLECGLCRGCVEVMGEVGKAGRGLIQRGSECPCDARCTGAKGPHCDCQCMGKNHGTNAMVPVEWDRGSIPRIMMRDRESARKTADEWRAAVAAAENRIDEINEKHGRGWLPAAAFSEVSKLRRKLDKARRLKSHAGRLAALGVQSAEPSGLFGAVA